MKKVVIEFVIDKFFGADNTSFAFDGDCSIKRGRQVIECFKTLSIDNNRDGECAAKSYLREFELKHQCQVVHYEVSSLGFPIYNPKTFVDNAINEDWKNFNVDNIQLILDAYYSKFEDECRQCDIQPINDLNVYAEQMLNQILTDENQREVFYKFVVG